ncbi:MAG: allophanate hydrolase-related protein, partial [bacterium]
LEQWRKLGAELIEIDFAPFAESARLLYEGPWVTERFLATQALLESNPEAMHPVVREIIAPGENTSGADAFAAQYRLAALKKLADAEMTNVDLLITPTIPAQYRLQELLNDPIRLNSHLGYYTNYMNLLDYSALAVPGGFTPSGIPGGFTLVAEKFEDQRLLACARLWQSQNVVGTGAIQLATKAGKQAPYQDQRYTNVVVCGAHLEGLPLNWQLTERGATLIEKTRSSENYRLYALTDGKRPGMVRVSSDGAAIAVEVWRMPVEEFGSFVAAIPAPLGIGKVELADGRWESGFVCDGYGLEGARDITKFGGWRDYLLERAN